jgi:hypothetical protein
MANGKNQVTATPLTDSEELPSIPQELISQGKALQKAGTPFVTALSVQKPRNLDKVVAAMENEAKYAGAKFWYKLPFGGGIEGPSIGLAVSLAREWGNCAVTMDVQETDEAFFFTGRFIDLEKGYQLERAFRQRKSPKLGKFDAERTQDIAFQIGQSKTIRNVILNSVPRWLVERTIQAAKAAVAAGITPEKLIAERKKIVEAFAAKKVSLERLVAKIGKGMTEWTAFDIADLRGDYSALTSGDATIEELFPSYVPPAPAGPINVDDLPVAGSAPKAQEAPRSDADDSMTEEEKAAAVELEKAEAKAPAKKPEQKQKGPGGLFG